MAHAGGETGQFIGVFDGSVGDFGGVPTLLGFVDGIGAQRRITADIDQGVCRLFGERVCWACSGNDCQYPEKCIGGGGAGWQTRKYDG